MNGTTTPIEGTLTENQVDKYTIAIPEASIQKKDK